MVSSKGDSRSTDHLEMRRSQQTYHTQSFHHLLSQECLNPRMLAASFPVSESCGTELMDASTFKTCEQVRHAIDGSWLSPGTGPERTHPNFVSIAVGPVLPRRIPPVATFQYWSTPIKILISSASLESHESARSSPCRYGNRSTAQFIGCPDRGSQIMGQ